MRKIQFSIFSGLIATTIFAALFALSLSYYRYYNGTGPISVRPSEDSSKPIISIYRYVDYMAPYYGNYLQFAIWRDGKVVWRPEDDEFNPVPLTSTVDTGLIDKLFKALSRERLLDPRIRRNNKGTFHNYYEIQIATSNGIVKLSQNRDIEK